jgi:hypothetical protein
MMISDLLNSDPQPSAFKFQVSPPSSPSDSFAWHPLTNEQKARLSILAREAFLKLEAGRLKLEEGRDLDISQLPSADSRMTAFRHQESIKAIGKRITEACQRDFLPLKAHFQDLGGKSGQALNTLLRAESEPQRIAMHKLTQECRYRKLSLSYPEAICRKQYHCNLTQASAKQLWHLVFTIRNRRKTSRQDAKPQREKTKKSTADIPF